MAKDSIDQDSKGEEEALRREIAESKDTEPDAPTVIDVDSIDDDAPAPKRGERQSGRDSRYWMNKRDRDQYESELSRERAEKAMLQNQLQLSIAQQQQLLQRQVAQEPQVDPIDQEVDGLSNKIALIRQEYQVKASAGRITAEETARLEKELHKTELQIMERMAQKATRGMQPQGNPQQAAIKAHIDTNYPDVVANPLAIRAATRYEQQEMDKGRQPTLEEIMDHTRREFRLGKYKQGAPRVQPDYMRDRLSGTSRGASGGNDAPRQVVMTKELKKMANARFPKIADERKRHEAFAKELTSEDD